MPTLIYLEPLTEGHCAQWAELIIGAALSDSHFGTVRFVAPRSLVARLPGLTADPRVAITTLSAAEEIEATRGVILKRGLVQWQLARMLLHRYPGSVCFLPHLDQALVGAVFDRQLMRGRVGGILFRPPNRYGLPRTIKSLFRDYGRWAMYLALKRPAILNLMTLDELAARSWTGRTVAGLKFVPDPAPRASLLSAVRRCPRADGRQILLFFGALGARKGIFALLDSLPLLPPQRRSEIAVRFVGRILSEDAPAVHSAIADARVRAPDLPIELVEGFVSDSELAQEVVNCDIVLAPYLNHVGSSGVLLWAAAAGKPVVTQNTGLMGYQVSRYRLGACVNTRDPQALALALSQPPVFDKVRASAFSRDHSPDRFTNAILNTLLDAPARSINT